MQLEDGVFTGGLANEEAANTAEGASGTLTFENGDVYSGFFSKGRPNGLGELTFANGDHYAGICDGRAKKNGNGAE